MKNSLNYDHPILFLRFLYSQAKVRQTWPVPIAKYNSMHCTMLPFPITVHAANIYYKTIIHSKYFVVSEWLKASG